MDFDPPEEDINDTIDDDYDDLLKQDDETEAGWHERMRSRFGRRSPYATARLRDLYRTKTPQGSVPSYLEPPADLKTQQASLRAQELLEQTEVQKARIAAVYDSVAKDIKNKGLGVLTEAVKKLRDARRGQGIPKSKAQKVAASAKRMAMLTQQLLGIYENVEAVSKTLSPRDPLKDPLQSFVDQLKRLSTEAKTKLQATLNAAMDQARKVPPVTEDMSSVEEGLQEEIDRLTEDLERSRNFNIERLTTGEELSRFKEMEEELEQKELELDVLREAMEDLELRYLAEHKAHIKDVHRALKLGRSKFSDARREYVRLYTSYSRLYEDQAELSRATEMLLQDATGLLSTTRMLESQNEQLRALQQALQRDYGRLQDKYDLAQKSADRYKQSYTKEFMDKGKALARLRVAEKDLVAAIQQNEDLREQVQGLGPALRYYDSLQGEYAATQERAEVLRKNFVQELKAKGASLGRLQAAEEALARTQQQNKEIHKQMMMKEEKLLELDQALKDLQREREAERNAEAQAKLQEKVAQILEQKELIERELGLTTKEKIMRLLKKYGLPAAVASLLAALISAVIALAEKLKKMGRALEKAGQARAALEKQDRAALEKQKEALEKQVAALEKKGQDIEALEKQVAALEKKAQDMASKNPGLLNLVISLVERTAGEILKFVGHNLWILVLALGVLLLRYNGRRN